MTDFAKILENDQEVDDPIYVVGCPRSGTSMLGRAIAQSPEIGYLEETGLVGHLYFGVASLSKAIARVRDGESLLPVLKAKACILRDRMRGVDWLKEFIIQMVSHAKLPEFDLRPSNPLVGRYGVKVTFDEMKLANDLRCKYHRLAHSNPEKMVRVCLKDFELLAGKTRALEKTPTAVFRLPSIRRIFPKVKVCHIMRDAKPVVASFLVTFGKTVRNPVRYICKIYANALRVDREMRASQSANYLPVRYEALLSNPEAVIRDVFAFLDLPCDRTVLSAARQIRPTESNWEKLPLSTRRNVEQCLHRYLSAAGLTQRSFS